MIKSALATVAIVLAAAGIGQVLGIDNEPLVTAQHERAARAQKTDVTPEALFRKRPAVPIAHDFMSWQVVDGKPKPRFYCSSRCRREAKP